MTIERRADESLEDFRARRDREREKLERLRDEQDLQRILDIPEGRRLIWRILSYAGVHRLSMTGNSQTFFNEGRRDVGLFILNEIEDVHPYAWIAMQKEVLDELSTEATDDEEESDD